MPRPGLEAVADVAWFRKDSTAEKASATSPSASANSAPPLETAGATLDEALTTLASVLRTMGQIRFPIGEDEQSFADDSEAWARHVMSGGAAPVDHEGPGRVWRGVREHIRRRRVAERDYIDARIGGFTEVLQEIVSQLKTLVGSSDQAASMLQASMDRLGESADEATLEQLRAHVRHTVREVRDTVENQRSQFSTHVRSLGERLAAVNQDLDQAREEAKLDPLTQLYSGSALEKEIDRGSRVAELSGIALSLVCVRVDDLGSLIAAHGPEVGDSIVQAVADCISLCFFRKSDCVARYDEERFAIFLWDTDRGPAERSADRLVQKIRRLRIQHGDDPLEVTASVGVSTRQEAESRESFVQRALGAADHASRGGGDRRETAR